jgi:hypothetical protein
MVDAYFKLVSTWSLHPLSAAGGCMAFDKESFVTDRVAWVMSMLLSV